MCVMVVVVVLDQEISAAMRQSDFNFPVSCVFSTANAMSQELWLSAPVEMHFSESFQWFSGVGVYILPAAKPSAHCWFFIRLRKLI
jgi:hypothetical protein